MAGNMFDVFVVGSTDPSTAGETRLAAALSTKHGIPLATVAKAIAVKNLRAGQSLDQAQAQALVRQLQSIGAVTVIRPAAPSRPQSPSPATRVPGQPALPPPLSVPPPVPAFGRTLLAGPASSSARPGAPSGLANAPNAAMSTVPMGGLDLPGLGMTAAGPGGAGDPFAPLAPSPAAAPAPSGIDPFQPWRAVTPPLATAARPRPGAISSPASQGAATASGLALDDGGGTKLELARGDRITSDDEIAALRARPSGSAASLREIGMKEASGVAMDQDPKNLNLVRCVQHGLYYDKTKASGCRKCLSAAREFATKMQAKPERFRVGDLRDKPAKRAFLGLAFALVIGFLPAAYYCFGPGAATARNLRFEQELLSRKPGTEEILHRFDELDAQVSQSHNRATRNSAIVWLAVSSLAMLGWYRIT